MRKRLSVLLIMFILILMLTALVSFAQTGDETAVPVVFTAAAEENSGTSSEDTRIVTEDGSGSEESVTSDVSENPESYSYEETACDPEENTCVRTQPDSEEESKVSLQKDTGEDNSSGKLESRNETENKQSESRMLLSSEVSWHMNFNVDCVSSGCIALSDRSAGMYVSACNDGGGEYNSVTFSPVNHTGKFDSYYVTAGSTPSLGSSNSTAIQNPASSFSYGPVPVNTCVTAVFESEFNDPPADYTQYKRFEFKLTADNGNQVQSTNAYADKYGCYAPSGETGISASVKTNSACVNRNAEKAVYEIRIDNAGTADICKTTVSADKPGTFHLKNSTASSAPFVYNQTIYTEDYITVIFEEYLSNAGLSAGSSHRVNFTVSSESCTSNGGSAQTSAFGQIEICSEPTATQTTMPTKTPTRTPVPAFTATVTGTPVPTATSTPAATKTSVPTVTPISEPGIEMSIEMVNCSDPDSDEPDQFVVTVKNTGDSDFCRVEVYGPFGSYVISDDGSYTADGSMAVINELQKGQSVSILFGYRQEIIYVKYSALYFASVGFTDDGGSCIEAIETESSIVPNVCGSNPRLDLDFTVPSDCSDPTTDSPDEFPITVTNSGDRDFCKIVITGPSGSVFRYNGNTTDGNTLILDGLRTGQSALITAFYKGHSISRFYSVAFSAEGYIRNGIVCSEKPAASAEDEQFVFICLPKPEISAEIDASGECHVYSGDSDPDRFDYVISNPGSAEYCSVSVKFDVIVNGTVVRSETIDVDPQSIPVGGSLSGIYEVIPEEIPEIQPGGTYSVRFTANASSFSEADGCPSQPSVSSSDLADKPVCEDVKPVIAVANLNPACVDAGDTLKFKGMIDVDSHSAAKKISVQTGKISWGGSSYDCEIVSVKKSVNTEFTDIPADQRGTSYEFEDFGHGAGAIGFVCEAKTAENDQKRSGQTLSFNASAVVKPAGNAAEYRIESNTVTGSQQCVYTHTTQLPYTGDDTNMPVLIGLFSLFVICGGASSFVILRKKKADIGEAEPKE